MLNRHVLLVVVIGLLSTAVRGAPKRSQLTRFQPISQAEYDSILALTDGKPVVSEGRLIEGGLAALAGLASDWVTSLPFLRSFGLAQKSTDTSYPLCVIKTEENPHSNHYHEHHQNDDHFHDNPEGHETSNDHHAYTHTHYVANYLGDYDSHDHDSGAEVVEHTNHQTPVVNCIVVLRDKGHREHKENDEHYHTTTKRPKRPRKKHRVHSPQKEPSSVYHHVHISPSSYNTPWFWSSPYHNQFYSDAPVYTASYPAAFPNIYPGFDAGAFSGSYPVTYLGSFASPAAGNNLNPYYNPYPSTYPPSPPSALRRDTFNTQPSSSANSYPNMEIPVSEKDSPDQSSMDSNSTYEMQSSEENATADQQEESHDYYSLQEEEETPDNYYTLIKSKMKVTTRVPMTSYNTSTKHKPIKVSRPKKEMEDIQSLLPKITPTRRHTKAKRDEASSQSNSYTKITSYSENGYQQTLYPQNSYQSNYPKVSYTHALPYPAPIYVPNSIDRPSAVVKTKKYYANVADSEENDDSTEFIQVRRNL